MKPMKFVLGALAMGWLAADARAVDSPYAGAPRTVQAAPAAPAAPATPAAPSFNYASDGGGCSSCGAWDSCCGPCRFYAGAGFYVFQPRFEKDPAIVATFSNAFDEESLGLDGTGVGGAFFPDILTSLSFAYDYEIAPRVWVGVVNDCGCGVRARWWGIDQDAKKFIDLIGLQLGNILLPPVPPATVGSQFDFSFTEASFVGAKSDLELNVFDLELTYEAQCCGWWQFSAGVRFVDFQQFYGGVLNATLRSEQIIDGQAINLLTVTQHEALGVDDEFQALGGTASAEWKFPLGCFNLSLYSSARISFLVGHGETTVTRALTREQTSDVAGTLEQFFEGSGRTVRDRDDIYWVGELELGIECCKECQCGQVFGRVGLAAQSWWDVVIPTSTLLGSSNIFRGFETLETRNTEAEQTDLHFFGLTATVGIRF